MSRQKCRGCGNLSRVAKACIEAGMLAPEEDLQTLIDRDATRLEELGLTHAKLADALKTLYRLCMQKLVDCRAFRTVKDVSDLANATETKTERKLIDEAIDMAGFRMDVIKICQKEQWSVHQMYESELLFNGEYLRVLVITWGGACVCPFKETSSAEQYDGYRYGNADVWVLPLRLRNQPVLRYSTLLPHLVKHHHFLRKSPQHHFSIPFSPRLDRFCWTRTTSPEVPAGRGRAS